MLEPFKKNDLPFGHLPTHPLEHSRPSSARKRQEEVKRVSLMREHKLLSVHGGDVPRALDKMLVILHVRDLKHS